MILLFQNVRQAIQTEYKLRQLNIEIKVISVPRSISAECGVAIEFYNFSKEQMAQLLQENNLAGTVYEHEYKK